MYLSLHVPDTLQDTEDTQKTEAHSLPQQWDKGTLTSVRSRSRQKLYTRGDILPKSLLRSLWETHFQPEALLLYSLFHPDESWQFVVVIKMVIECLLCARLWATSLHYDIKSSQDSFMLCAIIHYCLRPPSYCVLPWPSLVQPDPKAHAVPTLYWWCFFSGMCIRGWIIKRKKRNTSS